MKLFVDSANLRDIEEALGRGFSGITTNPSLLAKEPKSEFEKHIGKIVDLILKYNPFAHLSVEVFSRDAEEILNQARNFKKNFGLQGLSVKVQIGWDELRVINALFKEGISVNCTCNMSVAQALLAATAGAEFISFFWGRIRDGGERKRARERNDLIKKKVLTREDFNPFSVVHEARALFDCSYPNAKIIAGSMRSVSDIVDAGLSGAHIVTVPPKFFKDMISHFKTDEVVEQFFSDFKEWIN